MFSPRSSRAAALGLVLAALAPATAFADQDLRSPDARDLAAPARTDLRSPDTYDLATPVRVDLRAPDSRDAADGRSAPKSPSVVVVRMPQRTHGPGTTDWSDVGLGAGGALVIFALSTGGALAVHRRRHVRAKRTPAPVRTPATA
jgi:hypothetical protein